jgi:hypothetical protein
MVKKISEEMVTAAYNSAYKGAGRGLGHVANNIISRQVGSLSGVYEDKIRQAKKEKDYAKAAALIYESIVFRNVINPYVGGGTNWVVLKGKRRDWDYLVQRGALMKHKKMDLTSEQGIRNLEESMYSSLKIRDKFLRGAIGGGISLIATGMFFALTDTDKYREWRRKICGQLSI